MCRANRPRLLAPYMYVCVCVYVYIYVCIYIYIYIHTHTHTHTHTHIHTHTHTHTRVSERASEKEFRPCRKRERVGVFVCAGKRERVRVFVCAGKRVSCFRRPSRDLLQCQKRPITVSKETYYSVKRYLLQCQKRPITVSRAEDNTHSSSGAY